MTRSLCRCAVRLGLLFLLAVPVAAIAQSDNGATKVPRTPWGHPDLQGVWDYRTSTPLERPEDQNAGTVLTDDAAATFTQRQRDAAAARRVRSLNADWSDKWESGLAGERTALIVDPPSGRRPPLTPEAEEQRLAWQARRSAVHGPEDRDPTERCIVRQAPPIWINGYNNNLLLLQTPWRSRAKLT